MPVEMAAEMAAEMEEKNMMVQDEELYLAEEYEGPTVKRFKSV
jgi:hypothetical protein